MSMALRVRSAGRFLASGLGLAAALYGAYAGARWLRHGPAGCGAAGSARSIGQGF